ncbi:MAG: hypothetical protein KKB50_11785 [Planctomycetes bacterium]|nr:hypothetical protein [Planctomycetota bacterium]
MHHLDIESAHRLVRGLLSASDERRCRDHADTCPRCRELLAEERAWANLLDLDPERPPPNGALERVLDRIESVAPALRRVRLRRRLAGAAGCVGLIAIVVAGVFTLRGPVDEAEHLARALGISPHLQAEVIANYDALAALGEDGWLVEDYVAVRTLDSFIEGGKP